MNSSSLSQDSTIYSYKLILKMRHTPVLITMYWGLLALFAFFLSVRGGPLWLLVAIPSVMVLQTIITRLVLWMLRGSAASLWGWRFGALWIGVLPTGFAPMSLFWRIQSSLLIVGLAAVAALYPWLPRMALDSLLFVHLWLTVPRWIMALVFRRKAKSAWVKINPHDTSCYVQ